MLSRMKSVFLFEHVLDNFGMMLVCIIPVNPVILFFMSYSEEINASKKVVVQEIWII